MTYEYPAEAGAQRMRELRRLTAENARLRAWLRAMVDEAGRSGAPTDCGWCVELRGWAVEALAGTPFDPAVVRDEK